MSPPRPAAGSRTRRASGAADRPCSGRRPRRRTPGHRLRRAAPHPTTRGGERLLRQRRPRARGSRRRRTAASSSSSGSAESTRSAASMTSGPIPSPGRRTTFILGRYREASCCCAYGTSPPAPDHRQHELRQGRGLECLPSTSTAPVSGSMPIAEPAAAAATASGQVTMRQPEVDAVAVEDAREARPDDEADARRRASPAGTCSREEPVPKFDADDEDVSPPSWSRSDGSRPSKRCGVISSTSMMFEELRPG